MKIHNFRAEKIHGYLDLAIDLRSELTFLTGINGSGKTSAVRTITALLSPSVRDLANMAYTAVSVKIEHDGQLLTIRSERSPDEICLSCTGVEGDLRIPVLRREVYESPSRFADRERDFYREQEAINARNPVLISIEKLPTPMFLDLERRNQSGLRSRRPFDRFQNRIVPANPLAGSFVESLADSQLLAEEFYRKLLAQRAQLTDDLKQDIILTAFEIGTYSPLDSFFVLDDGITPQFESNETLMPNALSRIGVSEERVEQRVKPFFARVRKVSESRPQQLSLSAIDKDKLQYLQEWSALQPQIRQIGRLADLIEIYSARVQQVFAPVDRYLKSVNQFLADSGKSLSFDKSGNLEVDIPDGGKRQITALSSGERQVVVILTHLAFNRQAKRANVLIIDEPELSLHLRWQELFVDAVMEGSPGVQLILATHSPSIIKNRIENCVEVRRAGNDKLFD